MANNLGSLVVSLGLDAAEFTRGMSKSEYEAKRSTDRLKSEFGSLAKYVAGLGIGAALVGAIRSTADYQDEMSKLGRQAGTTTEDISRLAYAARQADVDNEQLAKGLRELGKDAQEGGKKLGELGISVTDASGRTKSSAQLFRELADVISAMDTPQQKAAASAKLLGERAGPQMASLLSGGSAGLKALGDEAERFGRIVTTDAGIAAEQFNDNLTKMHEQAQGLANIVGNSVLPVLTRLTESFIAADVGGNSFAKTLGGALKTGLETTVVLGRNVAYVLETIGDTLGATVAGYSAVLRGDIAGAKAIGDAYREVSKERRAALDAGDASILGGFVPNLSAGSGRGTAADPRVIGSTAPAAKTNPPKTPPKVKDPYAESAKYLDNLKRQLESTEKLTVVEATLRDIQLGRLGKVSDAQRISLLDTASQIDAAREFEDIQKQFETLDKESLARKKALADAGAAVFEATRTPLEQLNTEMAELDRLLAAGAISWDTYARASLDAADKAEGFIGKVTDGAAAAQEQSKRLGDAFSSTFDSAFREGQSFGDLLKKLAYDAINIQFLTPAAQKAGTALGSIVSGLFGGARAGGGGVTAGTSYLIGEKGPELWTAPASGNIIPNHALASMGGGGGGSVTINQSFDFRNADQSSVVKLRAEAARIKEAAVAEVFARVNRGGSAAAAMGRR